MKKQLIKLTENDIHNIVRNVIKETLNGYGNDDISGFRKDQEVYQTALNALRRYGFTEWGSNKQNSTLTVKGGNLSPSAVKHILIQVLECDAYDISVQSASNLFGGDSRLVISLPAFTHTKFA